MWDPQKVQADLKSQFGFDELRAEQILNYSAELQEVCFSHCRVSPCECSFEGVPEVGGGGMGEAAGQRVLRQHQSC